ncbi:MAG: hypothetical protein P1U40_03815 [Coxiellaceae bacterium]|nr:hypothetical protein [Coxiellaceae bacterium]
MSDMRERLGSVVCAITMVASFTAYSLSKIMFEEGKYQAAGFIFAGTAVCDALFIAGCCYHCGVCAQANKPSTDTVASVHGHPDMESGLPPVDTTALHQQPTQSYGSLGPS